MKKILSAILLISILALSLLSCAKEPDNTKIRVGYMSGPTGIGMAKLIHDNGGAADGNEKYSFTNYANNTTQAQADLTAGKIDMICVPTNNIAAYYNTTDQNITVLSINTLGSLYLVAKDGIEINSIDDLAGKTIYTCQKGTPKIVIDKILEKSGVNATVSYEVGNTIIDEPSKIAPQIIKGAVDIAVLPEPMVSNALAKNTSYSVKLNLGEVWSDEFGFELTMGCIVANKNFTEAHPEAVKRFLKEYESSIRFMADKSNLDTAADYAINEGILPFEKNIVKNAITNLENSIAYIDGKDMKEILKSFYSAIGIKSPGDDFYYEK